jgi:hypothetical protein
MMMLTGTPNAALASRASIAMMPRSILGSARWDEVACRVDDGQPDLPSGGHAELPDGGQHDYLVSLRPWWRRARSAGSGCSKAAAMSSGDMQTRSF